MSTVEFLSELRSRDVTLSVDGDRLRCNAPKGALTTELRAELARRKAEIVAFLHEAGAAASRTLPPIRPAPRDDDLPLSLHQQRLWFLEQLDPGRSTYNIPLPYRVRGRLDEESLRRSLNEIVRRHEILRTVFPVVDGRPRQVIQREFLLHLPVTDLRHLSGPERELETQRRVQDESRRPFDLASGPLVRAELLRLGEDDHALLLTVHHIAFDAWSFGVFTRELVALYQAFQAGMPSPLADLAVQYADFGSWQRDWLQGEVLESELAYWKEQLSGIPSLLELPTDRPRRAAQTLRGATEMHAFPGPLSESLEGLSQREGTTLFMTLLAAFKALLSRYTGQTDLVVGSPIANRTRPELEGLIGFFVNSLALRTRVDGDPTFRELLARVRKVCLDAFAHQHVPFEKLVEELQPVRDMSHTPLYQVMFVLENATIPTVELPEMAFRPIKLDLHTAKFDMTLYMLRQGNELIGALEYNTDLFDPATARRMLQHYRALLECIVQDPDKRVSRYSLLSETERHQSVVEWNRTAAEYPRDIPVHRLFEKQAARSPWSVAVVHHDQQWTYGELNVRANQLAHYLIKLGVGPEVMVALCVERSLDMVVGMLGILKAGGVYVPLDPDYPKQRLAWMLEDIHAAVLLTQARLLDQFADHHVDRVCLDTDCPAICSESDQNPARAVCSDNLAYVIYTSGSTGSPKGSCVPHRAINRLVCQSDYVRLEPADRIAQISNSSFDAATFEIWGALVCGAQVIIVPREVSLTPHQFAEELCRHGITTTFLTTALFNQMAREVPAAFLFLQNVLFGGEKVDPGCVRSVLRHGPPQRLLHMYGPTETTTFATWHQVRQVDDDAITVPIGRPIANTLAYVLDPYLQPVPVGVPGELYIGGDGLARAYRNAPELTAQMFVPHPLSDEPGARLYKTGDIARYLPDGNIQFLGRRDGQVKLRGFRIEIDEVETALLEHPRVREAVVLLREDDPGHKRLVAYVSLDVIGPHEPHLSGDFVPQLHAHAKARLPEYMVPSAFVVLDALPLNANGKVNRGALPPASGERHLETAYVAPRSGTQREIAKVWREVLRVDDVGLHDNFFELGGHSMLATMLVSRLRDGFGLELSVRQLFEGPTVAELAERVDATRWAVESLEAAASDLSPSSREEGTI